MLQYLTRLHDLHALRLTPPLPSTWPHSAQQALIINWFIPSENEGSGAHKDVPIRGEALFYIH
jgi:hypothetical protein